MSELKTVDIKGKAYVEVNERIRHFRTAEEYKGWTLESDIISNENSVVTFKAIVKDSNDRIVAVGHAQEKEGSTFINKTSHIENCETSAWGRALGNLGIGVDTSIASKEEVENAIANQKETPKQQPTKKPYYKQDVPATNEEMVSEGMKIGLANVMGSLNKDENKEFKPQVLQEMCSRYKVDKWADIKFDNYVKFTEEVKGYLQKLKDEKEVGI
jgi:hypothetical protein